jgi:predicted NACHT family NTPase
MLTIRLIGIGAAIAILLVAAGNSGQVGLSQWQPVRTLTGHTDWVTSVAFSPDGRLLASGSFDKTIELWEVATGSEVDTLGPTGYVVSVAFSPDGRLLASGSSDKTIRLWEVATGSEVRTLTGHTDWVYSVAFSPDGRLLASGSGDRTIKLWEVTSGSLVRTLTGHTGGVTSVAFSPDGRLLASGSGDRTIKLWEVTSGSLVRTLTGHTGGVTSVAFSPDGRLLASGSLDATIKLWEVASGREVRTLSGHTGGVTSVAFSPDGRLLASGSGDRTIKLWEVTSGSLVRTLTGHTDWVYSVAFSPDGRLLASGSGDTTITLWEWQEAPITAVVIVWESRFPYDSSNRVINFVQLVSWAGRCAVLDNVDIFNKTGYSANNFEVVLDGSYTLVRYYTDPRYPAAFDVQKDGGVTIFRWRFRREVPSGSFAHLGLWVAECDLRIKAMLWTKDERIIGKLPASSVRLGPTGQVEVVNNLDERIEIANVKFVQVNIPIPLPALNAQQLPPQLQQQGVNLQPVPNLPPVVPINPGMAAPLPGVNVGPGGCPPEPNDDFKTASPITLPFFARCEINPDGENDFFMFRLDSYYRVTVDVAAERIGSKLDAILILWDERGRDIAYNDDYKGSDPFLSLGLAPGIYYIQVAPHGGHGAGPYELRVQAER